MAVAARLRTVRLFARPVISRVHLCSCHLLHVFLARPPAQTTARRRPANIPIIYRFIQRLVNLVSLAGRARLEVTFVCFVLTMPRERGRGRAGADPGAIPIEMGQKYFMHFSY